MLEWKNEYSVSNDEIDKQHKRLFEIGSELYVLLKSKKYDAYDDIVSVLDELEKYTVYHFDYEEKLMKKYGYAGYEEQKREHDAFIRKLEETNKLDIDEEQLVVMMDLVVFVANWITAHILKSDMQYKDFFMGKM
jgi:hemerythrin